MPTDNRISIIIAPEDQTAINDALNVLRSRLQPYLTALTPEERRSLAKMSDKTIPFVDKTMNYASTNPEFAPPYLNVGELSKDVQAVEILNSFANTLEQLATGVEDTMMLAGSEAYVASLAYYSSVKEAAKRNIINAKTIYEDLKQRFPQSGKPAALPAP